jgi:hypothetical protein
VLDELDVMPFSRLSGLTREKVWNALSARKRSTFKKPGCSKGIEIEWEKNAEKIEIPIGDRKGSIKGRVIRDRDPFWTPRLIVNAVREV